MLTVVRVPNRAIEPLLPPTRILYCVSCYIVLQEVGKKLSVQIKVQKNILDRMELKWGKGWGLEECSSALKTQDPQIFHHLSEVIMLNYAL